MLEGWLIVNGFLQISNFTKLYQALLTAATNQGVKLTLITNDELLIDLTKASVQLDLPDFALFWDKDLLLAAFLEEAGLKLFNKAAAIAACDDKALMHLLLHRNKIKTPPTMLAPKTFARVGYEKQTFLDPIVDTLGLPIILKKGVGSFGEQVYLLSNREELMQRLEKFAGETLVLQKFVTASYGRDLRLYLVGDEVLGAMLRKAPAGEFRANMALGGSMELYRPSNQEKELALAACRALELDFAGVDLLFGDEGEPLLCEVNSNAHFLNFSQCTGIDVAAAIIKMIRAKLVAG